MNWDTISTPKDEGGLGIRCVRSLNRAYILKLWWKMLHHEDNTTIKVLKDKYFKSNNVFRSFSYGPHLWKAMGKVGDFFKDNVLWGIGKGLNVNLWEDRWTGERSLRQLVHGPVQLWEGNLMVSNIIVNDTLDFSTLSFELPDCVFNLCRAISLPIRPLDLEDFMFSKFSTNGKFDFK